MENSFRISLRTLGYIIAYCKNYWRKNAIFCYFAASSFSPVLKLKRFNKEVSKLNNLNYKIPSVAKYRFTNLLMTLELFFLLNSTRNRLRERVKVLKVTRLWNLNIISLVNFVLPLPNISYIVKAVRHDSLCKINHRSVMFLKGSEDEFWNQSKSSLWPKHISTIKVQIVLQSWGTW